MHDDERTQERERRYRELDAAAYATANGEKARSVGVMNLHEVVYWELMVMLYKMHIHGLVSRESAAAHKAKYRAISDDYALILGECAAWGGYKPEDFTAFLTDPDAWTEPIGGENGETR